jgi:MarR family transcriptional regulator for hemolysin
MSSIITHDPPPPPEPLDLPASDARLGRLMGTVYRKWRRYIDTAFRAYGFSDATRGPLISLYDSQAPLRQGDLAQILGLEPTALVRVIPILEKRGLVTCAPAAEDKRTKVIALTDNGRAWAEFIIAKSYQAEVSFLADLAPQEIATVRAALTKVSHSIPDG